MSTQNPDDYVFDKSTVKQINKFKYLGTILSQVVFFLNLEYNEWLIRANQAMEVKKNNTLKFNFIRHGLNYLIVWAWILVYYDNNWKTVFNTWKKKFLGEYKA